MAWPECHALLSESDSLLQKLQVFKFDSVTSEKVTIVEQLLNSDVYKADKIRSEHQTAAILLEWVASVLTFFKSKTALAS